MTAQPPDPASQQPKQPPVTIRKPPEPQKERTTSTFLDAYNNNNGLSKADRTTEDAEGPPGVDTGQPGGGGGGPPGGLTDSPMVTWETSGEGKKIPIVIFNCGALSKPQPQSVGQKYHLTFKTVNADAKLVSQVIILINPCFQAN